MHDVKLDITGMKTDITDLKSDVRDLKKDIRGLMQMDLKTVNSAAAVKQSAVFSQLTGVCDGCNPRS